MATTHLDVGDSGDSKHAANEEAGQDVVMIPVSTQPHLDLQTAVAPARHCTCRKKPLPDMVALLQDVWPMRENTAVP